MADSISSDASASCDRRTKALADTTKTTALTAETARHNKQLLLMQSGGLVNLLLGSSSDPMVVSENSLHNANLQKIQSDYNDSLQAAHC